MTELGCNSANDGSIDTIALLTPGHYCNFVFNVYVLSLRGQSESGQSIQVIRGGTGYQVVTEL